MSSLQTTYLRANLHGTMQCHEAIIEYANLPGVNIKLCVTRKYINTSELPVSNATLIQNSPLLTALITLKLPAIDSPMYVVIDTPGLTTQRENRKDEVILMLKQLVSLPGLTVNFGVQPINATSHLSAIEATTELLSCDYTTLTTNTSMELLRLLQ